MIRFIQTILHPERYHGHGRSAPFFEGWYYKLIDASERHRYAIIPGVSLSGEAHAFIQMLNGVTGDSTYHTYPLSQFWAAKDGFEVHIGPNRFAADGLQLHIDRPEQGVFGRFQFSDLTPWPVTLTAPGVMGWYAWVPFMECYHGVLSLDHAIHGQLQINNKHVDFKNGRGYIEKDWGRSFPSAWVWMQTNHFQTPGVSLTGSVAVIPWVRQSFLGFIIGFWHEEQLYRFATYTGAHTEKLVVNNEQVDWVVRDEQFRLEMLARRSEGGLLKGPTTQDMGKRVVETMNASIKVRLSRIDGGDEREIFAGNGRHAGLEVQNHQQLLAMLA